MGMVMMVFMIVMMFVIMMMFVIVMVFMIVMMFMIVIMIKITFNPRIFLPVVKVNIEISSPNCAFCDAMNVEVETIHSQFLEFCVKKLDICPKVHKKTIEHIATYSRKRF